jgi:predicted ABC-type ATPase
VIFKLQFTVIAGPNGAGKSTFSTRISRFGTLIFDPDKEKYSIAKQYPDISEEALENAVTSRYDYFEAQSIAGQKNLTVETNLRNDFLAERVNFFRKNGYETRLVYLLLPDIESSMDRVNLRVKKKGHFVDAESIRFNFEKGLENLVRVTPNFDRAILASAAPVYGMVSSPELFLNIKHGIIVYNNKNIPDWALTIVDNVLLSISRPSGDSELQKP